MAFGRELNDFVNGFQKGWTLVDNSQRTKAYSEQIKNAKDAKSGLAPKDEIDAYSAKHPPLPVTGDTLSTPGAIKPPAKTSAVPIEEEEKTASFEKGGRVSTYQKRFPPPGREGAIYVPPDEEPYNGEEDETFTPIADRPSATDQARGAAPTPVFSRNTMARPEEAPAVGAREVVGDMPGRSRGMGGPPAYREWSAKDERARSRQGPRSNYGPSTGDSIMEIPEDETAPSNPRTHRMLPGVPRDSAPIGAVDDQRDPRDRRPPSEVPTRQIGQRGVLQPLPPDVPDPRKDPQFATEPQHAREGMGPYDGLGQERDRAYRAGTGAGPYDGLGQQRDNAYHTGTERGPYDDPYINPGRGGAPYPAEPYHAGTGEGPYADPYIEPGREGQNGRTSGSPPVVRGTTPAAPPRGGGSAGRQTSPPAVPGATGGGSGGSTAAGGSAGGGASRAAKAGAVAGAGLRSGAIPVEDPIVSQREIEANHMTPQQVQELSEARRASQRMSASRGEDPNEHINRPTAAQRQLHVDIDHGHNAVDGAVAFLTKTFGLGGKGALPVAGAGPSSGGMQALLKGEGAASPQEVQAVERTVDPNGEMSEARRVMLALAATHEWHLKNGRPKEAQTAAASLLQYYQLTAGRLGAIAKVALSQGDVTGAVKAATAAYNRTPDGKELAAKVQPDGKTVAYKVTNLKDGKTVAQGAGPAEQLLAGVGTPLSYLTQAAGARKAGAGGGSGKSGGGGGGRHKSGGGGAATGASGDLNGMLEEVRSASAALAADPENAELKTKLADAEKKVRAFKGGSKNALWNTEKLQSAIDKAKGGSGAGGGTGGGKSAGSEKERAATKTQEEMAKLTGMSNVLDQMESTGLTVGNNGKVQSTTADNAGGDTAGFRSENTSSERVRRELEPKRTEVQAAMADRTNEDFEIKPTDRASIETKVGEHFDDLENGPFAPLAKPDPKTKELKVSGISPGEIQSLKAFGYEIAQRNNMPIETAAKTVMALTAMDRNSKSDQPPFKVMPDGRISLRDGTMTVKLGGDTLKQLLIWRKRRAVALEQANTAAEAEKTKAVETSAARKRYWGKDPEAETAQTETYRTRRRNQWQDPEERKRLGIE